MLPSANHLARRHGAFCLKYRVTWRECSEALAGALKVASELAGDRAEDEPAALLYALTLRPRALGDAWIGFPVTEACRLARDAGSHLDLRVDDVELENLRLGTLDPRTGIGFGEVRDFVAARTRPAFLRPVK
jgi:hypothetical protein